MMRDTMKTIKNFLLMGLFHCALGGLSLYALDFKHLSLEDACRLSQKHHPAIQTAKAELVDRELALKQVQRWSNPEMELNLENIDSTSGSDPDGEELSEERELVFSQSLRLPGYKNAQLDESQNQLAVSRLKLKLVERDVVLKTSERFWKLFAAQKTVEIHQSTLRFLKRYALRLEQLLKEGKIPKTDFRRIQLESGLAQQKLDNALRLQTTASLELRQLWGLSEVKEIQVAGEWEHVELPEPDQFSIDQHAVIQLAKLQVQQAELQERLLEKSNFSNISLKAGIKNHPAIQATGVQVGLSLELPVFNRRKEEIQRQSNARLNQAYRQKVDRGRIASRIDELNANLRVIARQLENYAVNLLPLAETEMESIQLSYEEGYHGYLDVLDRLQNTTELRLQYNELLLENRIQYDQLMYWLED
ncbi:MAG: hypothetical protein CR997_01555 [Acidobacteria bacterium]|nr:MAG: hypothetical protein CR997_01555 [Acidobacteriota bacterium]